MARTTPCQQWVRGSTYCSVIVFSTSGVNTQGRDNAASAARCAITMSFSWYRILHRIGNCIGHFHLIVLLGDDVKGSDNGEVNLAPHYLA